MPRDFDSHLWSAHFRDTSHLSEIDEAGQDHGFAEVLAGQDEHGPVTDFDLLPIEGGGRTVAVKLFPGDDAMRPIFTRRRTKNFNFDTGEETHAPKLMLVGFQKTITVGRKTVNVKALLHIYPDGRIVLSDRDIDEQPVEGKE